MNENDQMTVRAEDANEPCEYDFNLKLELDSRRRWQFGINICLALGVAYSAIAATTATWNSSTAKVRSDNAVVLVTETREGVDVIKRKQDMQDMLMLMRSTLDMQRLMGEMREKVDVQTAIEDAKQGDIPEDGEIKLPIDGSSHWLLVVKGGKLVEILHGQTGPDDGGLDLHLGPDAEATDQEATPHRTKQRWAPLSEETVATDTDWVQRFLHNVGSEESW